jgi:hypothetical protein
VTVADGFNDSVPRTHGHAAHGRTPTYIAWRDMVQRCTNPSRRDWGRYGGRGITVCERWRRFENFLADMGTRPDGRTLDRIDNNGNYEPGNCRWTTWHQQYLNRRSNAGELHPNAKLTVDDVVRIRQLSREGLSNGQLAQLFNVTRANIFYVVTGRAWNRLARAAHAGQTETQLRRTLGATEGLEM